MVKSEYRSAWLRENRSRWPVFALSDLLVFQFATGIQLYAYWKLSPLIVGTEFINVTYMTQALVVAKCLCSALLLTTQARIIRCACKGHRKDIAVLVWSILFIVIELYGDLSRRALETDSALALACRVFNLSYWIMFPTLLYGMAATRSIRIVLFAIALIVTAVIDDGSDFVASQFGDVAILVYFGMMGVSAACGIVALISLLSWAFQTVGDDLRESGFLRRVFVVWFVLCVVWNVCMLPTFS